MSSPPVNSRIDEDALAHIELGSHVGWVVRDPQNYRSLAERILRDGVVAGEKVLLFGPSGSSDLEALRDESLLAADPAADFLSGDRLDPETMYSMFREAHRQALAEGYAGIRVMADMDWLLPLAPNPVEVMEFELLADRVIRDLGATVICAYRSASYEEEPISAVMSVHPVVCSPDEPPFRVVADGTDVWRIFGEVDLLSRDIFRAAISRVTQTGPAVIDVSGLEFIDAAGVNTLARVCAEAHGAVKVQGATDLLRKLWKIAGCEQLYSLN